MATRLSGILPVRNGELRPDARVDGELALLASGGVGVTPGRAVRVTALDFQHVVADR